MNATYTTNEKKNGLINNIMRAYNAEWIIGGIIGGAVAVGAIIYNDIACVKDIKDVINEMKEERAEKKMDELAEKEAEKENNK